MSPRLWVPALLLAAAGPAAAQGPPLLRFEGWEVFRFALHQKKIQPATTVREAIGSPGQSLVIVVGSTRDLHHHIPNWQLTQFIQHGGAVLIATDEANPQPDGWAGAGLSISVTGRLLGAGTGPRYRDDPRQPFVVPHMPDPRGPNLFDGFAAAGDRAVGTRAPSEMGLPLALQGFHIYPQAAYPDEVRALTDAKAVWPTQKYFAVALVPRGRNNSAGRVVVFADREVFANGMLGFVPDDSPQGYHFDNANWELANRTIDWLREGPGGEARTRCLFIENNDIVTQFAVPLPGQKNPPIPDIPPDVLANILLNSANGIIDEAQERNFFNRMVEGTFGFDRVLRMFLLFGTILFLYFALRWLRRAMRRPEPAVGSPTALAALVPRGGVLRQRTAAQIEVGNLYEAAARRVRDRFDVLGGRPGPGGGMPPVLISLGVWDAPALRQSVGWLWAIGYGDAPVNVPPVEWDRVNGLLERLTVRAADGDWTFAAEA